MTGERFADLHLHSTHSDGATPPGDVPKRAHAWDVAAISLTDHDAVSGLAEARTAAEALGQVFIGGVEISAQAAGAEVHVLGYGIDPEEPRLAAALARLREGREARADRIFDRLDRLGIALDRAAIREETGGAVGRMHIARAIHEAGRARSVQNAFDRYIKAGRPAYVEKARLPCDEAIRLIHEAGGVAALAHPGIGTLHRKLHHILTLPFDGVEVYHSKHSAGQSEAFRQIAEERGLLVTGGSDSHGEAKGQPDPDLGRVSLPMRYVEALLAAISAR